MNLFFADTMKATQNATSKQRAEYTTMLQPFIQGVQDQNLPKEMVTASSILVQMEKFLCQNSFLMRTIFSSP